MTMNPLLQLIACGQSYWLDNLTRDMITSGELKERVTEQGWMSRWARRACMAVIVSLCGYAWVNIRSRPSRSSLPSWKRLDIRWCTLPCRKCWTWAPKAGAGSWRHHGTFDDERPVLEDDG